MKPHCSGLTIFISIFLFSQAVAEDQLIFKAYPVYNQESVQLLEIMRDVVGKEGKVLYNGKVKKFFVRATTEQHIEIAKMLKTVNIPPRNIRFDITTSEAGKSSRSNIGAATRADIKVTPRGTSYRMRVTPDIDHQSSTSDSLTQQTLVIGSGTEGFLKVAQEVPYEEWVINFSRHWGYIQQKTVVREVGAFLRINAEIMGDGPLISVTVTPEISALVGDRRERIKLTRVSTHLTVQDGQTITIGGSTKNQDFYNKFLVGFGHDGRQQRVDITLTPHIMTPPAR